MTHLFHQSSQYDVVGKFFKDRRAGKIRPKGEIVMPDELALQSAARRRAALRAKRSGRVSTILDNQETLG